MTYINKSLVELGRVLESLKNNQPTSCRSSKLTFLLEEYLRGNSKTIVIGTVSPEINHFLDTKNTL